MAHGLILQNRVGDFTPQPQGFWTTALLVALAVGLWSHSKLAASAYVVLTALGLFVAITYAFIEGGFILGVVNMPVLAFFYLPSVFMILRWSDLTTRK